MPPLLLILLIPLLLYAIVCLTVFLQQEQMLFPGAGAGDRGVPGTQPPAVVDWLEEGGRRTRIVTLSPPAPQRVILYFVGNGEDLYNAAAGAEELAQYGAEVIGVEYPGYGASGGRPTYDSVLATARAAARRARARAAGLRLPLFAVGSSLGSFSALAVAAEGGVDRVVLRAPPTSIAAVAGRHYGWLPVRLLLRHPFDNLARAGSIACPVLVLHGDDDQVVPQALGRELAAALPHGRFVGVPGCGHNDLSLSPAGPAGVELRRFLGGL